ncbi:hypothetical protein D3C81_1590070 [compost metagenome]
MPMDGPQPGLRTGQEVQRREQHERAGVIQAAQPGADQAHVVIQRQPADKDVARVDRQRHAHGAQIGQQVGMRQHHALGRAGAAGGVLQQRDVVLAQHRMDRRRGGVLHLLRRQHALQRAGAGLEQGGERPRFGHRDQDRRLRIGQDAGVALQVVTDLRQPRWRV